MENFSWKSQNNRGGPNGLHKVSVINLKSVPFVFLTKTITLIRSLCVPFLSAASGIIQSKTH